MISQALTADIDKGIRNYSEVIEAIERESTVVVYKRRILKYIA